MTTVALVSSESTRSPVRDSIVSATWAVLLGIVSGSACVGVRLAFRFLQWIFVQHLGTLPSAAATLMPWRRVLTPMVGALLAILVTALARRITPRLRSEEYVEAVRLRGGGIPFLPTAWRTLASAFSIATGAAIGREGSMIQFAAAITSYVGAKSRIGTVSLSRQVGYGAAAAVAAAYQAPLAGVFFAAEIVLGEWTWSNVPLLFLASFSGWIVSRLVLGTGALFPVAGTLYPALDLFWAIPMALLFGVLGPAYEAMLHHARVAKRLPFALLWGGLTVGLLSLVEPRVWGNGDVALANVLQAHLTLAAIAGVLLLRIVATTACVGTGTVGGVFTPTLFVGAAMGLGSAHLLHSHEPWAFAVCGMGLMMSAVTHAPFMSALIAVELTGQWHLLPAILLGTLLATLVARVISRRSLYGIASPQPAR